MRPAFVQRLRSQRGSQTVEFVALFPLLLVAILLVWQFTLGAFVLVVAEGAARDGARAAAAGDDGYGAARRAAAGFNPSIEISDGWDAVEARVTIEVPLVPLEFLKDQHVYVTRTARMPKERPE